MPHKADTLYPGKILEARAKRLADYISLRPRNTARGVLQMIYDELLMTPLGKFKRAVDFHTKDSAKWNTSDPS